VDIHARESHRIVGSGNRRSQGPGGPGDKRDLYLSIPARRQDETASPDNGASRVQHLFDNLAAVTVLRFCQPEGQIEGNPEGAELSGAQVSVVFTLP